MVIVDAVMRVVLLLMSCCYQSSGVPCRNMPLGTTTRTTNKGSCCSDCSPAQLVFAASTHHERERWHENKTTSYYEWNTVHMQKQNDSLGIFWCLSPLKKLFIFRITVYNQEIKLWGVMMYENTSVMVRMCVSCLVCWCWCSRNIRMG